MLDKQNKQRDYLYGRLVAVSQAIEEEANKNKNVNVPTFTSLCIAKFVRQPFHYWLHIHQRVMYRSIDLSTEQRQYFQDLLMEIHNLFEYDDYINNSPLSGLYVLAKELQAKEIREHFEGVKNEDKRNVQG